ncbi:MAG: hypothetical protein ACXQS8_05930 [Candidatus Helarchaeales archaeon]
MSEDDLEITEEWINKQRNLPYLLKLQSVTKVNEKGISHRVVATNLWGNTIHYVVKDGKLLLESELEK